MTEIETVYCAVRSGSSNRTDAVSSIKVKELLSHESCNRQLVKSERVSAMYLLYQVALLLLFQDLPSQFCKKKMRYLSIYYPHPIFRRLYTVYVCSKHVEA